MFQRIFDVLANQGPTLSRLMIDATHLIARRTAASVRQKGGGAVSDGQQVDCIPGPMLCAMAIDVRYASL